MVLSDTCVSLTTACLVIASMVDKSYNEIDIDNFFYTHRHWFVLIATFTPISVSNLMLLTLDRLIAVKKPFVYADKFRNSHVYCLISAWWFLAALDIIAFELITEYVKMSSEVFKVLIHACHVCLISVGFLILSLSNILIFVDARSQLRLISNLSADQLNHHHFHHGKECRLIRMTIGLVVTYSICWLPCFVFSIYFLFTRDFNFKYLIAAWIVALMNYLLNPVMYVCLSHDVKTEIKKFFLKKQKVNVTSLTSSTI